MTNNKIVSDIALIPMFALSIIPGVVQAGEVDLEQYLQQIRSSHPFFIQQALSGEIEREQQHRFLGEEDWVVNASPSYSHYERSKISSAFVVEKQDSLTLNAGLERTFWTDGSRLSIDYDYTYTDQLFGQPVGSFDEHGNGINITYSLPLMKNKGGVLSRLDYELQAYSIDLTEINSIESQENFLEQQALLFIDWVFITEQRQIAENRLILANNELTHTKNKFRSRVVAEVDVLRAQDAVINARQDLSTIETQWRAFQAELATQSNNPFPDQMVPRFDLYTLQTVPPVDQALELLQKNIRQLRAIDLQMAQMEKLESGLGNQLKPELDLVLAGGLRSEASDLSGSARFNQPQYMIGVNFRYPLGQRSVTADISKARLQQQQLRAKRTSLSRQLEAQLRNMLVQLNELEGIIALNKEQIEVAQLRTAAELKRYNQGRSELSFVIQSRDNEQNARLGYAANAASYQKLWLRYKSLTDALFSVPEQD